MIEKFFIFLCICGAALAHEEIAKETFFFSTPEQIATLHSETDSLIGGVLNPLSGQLMLSQVDLRVQGAAPLELHRIYIPPYMPASFPRHKKNGEEMEKYYLFHHLATNYKGWQFYPHLKLLYTPSNREVLLTSSRGMTLNFRIEKEGQTLLNLPYGLSNLSEEGPRSQYDPRNISLSFLPEEGALIVETSEGSILRYQKKKAFSRTQDLYLLHVEMLPNGKKLRYSYINDDVALIESLDPTEHFVYASLKVRGSPWLGESHFETSTGCFANYKYDRKKLRVTFREKTKHWYGSSKGTLIFDYVCPPTLTSASTPAYRDEIQCHSSKFLLEGCFTRKKNFKARYRGYESEERVQELLFPVGEEEAYVPVYTINYEPQLNEERKTTVQNSDGTTTVYYFSKNLLLKSIQYFSENTLKKEKVFTWTDNQWLKSVELKEGEKTLHKKTYEYDAIGNPVLEIFSGDLSGKGFEETYTLQRSYNEKGLLLSETNEEGKTLSLTYLPGTHLITSKLIKEKEHILTRQFFTYDSFNNLIEESLDDGTSEDKNDLSNVTQKTLKRYSLRNSSPFLHMPEWIETLYWEEGTLKPLKKTHLLYDKQGNIAEEEIYDAEGVYRYSLYKTYNERGDLLSETNPPGQKALYSYDSRGRIETSTNFSGRIHKNFHHDRQGRLLKLVETGDAEKTRTFTYDKHDRLVEKRDELNNPTFFKYDPLTSKVIETDFPPLLSIDGELLLVKTSSTYDALGRELSKTDANGNKTHFQYNAYGSVIEKSDSKGKELFEYLNNGSLALHHDVEGGLTQFHYDILGHPLVKTFRKNGHLSQEFSTYSSFNLLSETNSEQRTKFYTYDGSGRKIREDYCGHISTFSYDPLGFLTTTTKLNGVNTLLIHHIKNLKGELIEETHTDVNLSPLSQVFYSYDLDGNQEEVKKYKGTSHHFTYDSFGRKTSEKNGNKEVTTYEYTDNFKNILGQKVLQVTTTNPLGFKTVETYDSHGHLAKKEKLDLEGNILSAQELLYDPIGNLTFQKDHLYKKGIFDSTQLLKYTHTPEGRVETFTRGYPSNERTTHYTYYPLGQLASKTLPNGTKMTYTYDFLGHLSHLETSGLSHRFTHDSQGELILAEDGECKVKRELDPFGNVLQETLPSGIAIDKEYDLLNRLTLLSIPSLGSIGYSYDPLFLRKVSRFSPEGDLLYEHSYESYDLDGHLILERLPGDMGFIEYTYTPTGQVSCLKSPYFSENCAYDSLGNLEKIQLDSSESFYTYDALSQLTSETTESQSSLYSFDSLYNRTQKNEENYHFNELNEVLSQETLYDLNGNQILHKTLLETFELSYDPLNRLIEALSENHLIEFSYDPLGRRSEKLVYVPSKESWIEASREHYLYHGPHEIGALEHNTLKSFRTLGLHLDAPKTVGIELDKFYIPLLDVQGNVRRLIDLETKTLSETYEFTAFGEGLSKSTLSNPWRFASKRWDPETQLIHFGYRDYNPTLGRWMTLDPLEAHDSSNLYQYVFNNPFYYKDPDGRFVAIPICLFAAELLIPTLTSLVLPAVAAAVNFAIAGAITYGIVHFNIAAPHACMGISPFERAAIHEFVERESLKIDKKKVKDQDYDNQKKGTPKPNGAQNDQFDDAAKEIERKLNIKLSDDQRTRFHRRVSKQGYNYQELVEEGFWYFHE